MSGMILEVGHPDGWHVSLQGRTATYYAPGSTEGVLISTLEELPRTVANYLIDNGYIMPILENEECAPKR